jgi:glutamyl-tRNA reductase
MGQLAGIAASKGFEKAVKDYRASIEKLRRDAAEAALIRDRATDHAKREIFDNLHKHFNRLAEDVEQAVKSNAAE